MRFISVIFLLFLATSLVPVPQYGYSHAASGGAGPIAKQKKVIKRRSAGSSSRKKRRRTSRNAGLCNQNGQTRGWHRASGGCKKLQRRYKKACGHSAYAATTGSIYEQGVCGSSLNRPSKSRAERDALRSCRNALKKYRISPTNNNCVIYMSK